MTHPPRVLVVDDDSLVHVLVDAALASSCTIASAASGESALRQSAADPPDLIVLDVVMPGMDGYETCRRLRADPATAEVPVIFLSGRTDVDERLEGYAAGGDDYLGKPFEADELRAKVSRALEAGRRQREMAGRLDEMTHAALSSVDMIGDAGVVLEFQRQLASCASYQAVASALLEAAGRFELEACVRLQGNCPSVTINSKGTTSALETSILDHLATVRDPATVHAVGTHAGFRLPHVLLFVRGLLVERPVDMDRDLADRMGRHVDNVALLVQGANTQIQAIDARHALELLAGSRQLVQLTREALIDFSSRDAVQRQQIQSIFEHLSGAIEDSFISLGLTHAQEEFLSDAVRTHGQQVVEVLESGRELEARLSDVIRQLEAAS